MFLISIRHDKYIAQTLHSPRCILVRNLRGVAVVVVLVVEVVTVFIVVMMVFLVDPNSFHEVSKYAK